MRGGSPEQCAGRAVRVVPRVVVELGGQEQIELLRDESAAAMSVEVLVSLISQYELDGLTLEVRRRLARCEEEALSLKKTSFPSAKLTSHTHTRP